MLVTCGSSISMLTLCTDARVIGEDFASEDFNFTAGQHVSGYVYKVDSEWAWISITRHVKAQLFVLDSACESSELQNFQNRFLWEKFFRICFKHQH